MLKKTRMFFVSTTIFLFFISLVAVSALAQATKPVPLAATAVVGGIGSCQANYPSSAAVLPVVS